MAARNGGGFAQNRGAEDVVDAQNREYHDRLASKTSYLKSIAFDMEAEAKDHHKLLDSLGDDMEGSSSLLGGSLSRVRLMMNSGRGNRQLMCYVSIGVVFGLFMLYLMMRKLFSGSSSSAPAPS